MSGHDGRYLNPAHHLNPALYAHVSSIASCCRQRPLVMLLRPPCAGGAGHRTISIAQALTRSFLSSGEVCAGELHASCQLPVSHKRRGQRIRCVDSAALLAMYAGRCWKARPAGAGQSPRRAPPQELRGCLPHSGQGWRSRVRGCDGRSMLSQRPPPAVAAHACSPVVGLSRCATPDGGCANPGIYLAV